MLRSLRSLSMTAGSPFARLRASEICASRLVVSELKEQHRMATDHNPAVYIETHGCKLNQADSQALALRFAQAGYRLVDAPGHADVHVVNTCTVTHVADRKARQALRSARRTNPAAVVVATGCYAQRSPRQLSQLDGVDLVLGNAHKEILVEQVNQLFGLSSAPNSTESPQISEAMPSLRTRVMMKIQEGCDQVCAYCIVPKVRGRERSLHPDALIAQVQHLTGEGCQEVVLTGTQLGSYGFDIRDASLAGLLRRILKETSVPRLRVSSLQPQELSQEILELWENPRLCPHFHLPLQSGSHEVLKAMRRRYSPTQYAQAVEAVRQGVPGASVTADVIVGFPGETKQQFQETHDLCQELQLSGLHVFPYSTRPGTSAAHMGPRVEYGEKHRRMQIMLSLAAELSHRYRQSLLGTIRWALWEASRSATGARIWSGLTDNYVRVAAESVLPLGNCITPVVLERHEGEVVWGRVIQ